MTQSMLSQDSTLQDPALQDPALQDSAFEKSEAERARDAAEDAADLADAAESDPPVSEEAEALLEHIKRWRGFDFTGYKRASLLRRVDKQMAASGVASYADYTDYLEVWPDEFGRLFNTILINVTSFFRDAGTWEYLASEVVPRLLASKGRGGQIRLWSAGCASGQEPYSLAMMLAEALGPEQFRDRVKIYATDVDEEALAQARLGSYTAREVESVPPALLLKYFERDGDRYVFGRDLRRALIFGRHDLMQDAPISRVDLLSCRNTLMYFNAEAQARIMGRFHFAVSDDGFLFLGKAEMLFSHASLFSPLDLKRRVFRKVPQSLPPARGSAPERADSRGGPPRPHGASPQDGPVRPHEALFQDGPVAQVYVDAGGALALANERARRLFRLADRDLGRPLSETEIAYRPVDLRPCIEQAVAERRDVAVRNATRAVGSAEPVFLNVLVSPLWDGARPLGVSVSFTDVTHARQLAEELRVAGREMETAYEELQSTTEELETTNEELQSTVEELETTNEELETTNEELHAINGELRLRSTDLDRANAYLESILSGLRAGVIVLDADLRVQVWNARSENFWGVRGDEARGRALLSLDIGLPVDALIPAVRACLADREVRLELAVDAHNRRGQTFRCGITVTPLLATDGETCGVILQMEEAAPDA